METRYLKICQEWNFAGLKIELQPSKIGRDLRYYKIYDQHDLEICCLHFWVFEIVEGKDVLKGRRYQLKRRFYKLHRVNTFFIMLIENPIMRFLSCSILGV